MPSRELSVIEFGAPYDNPNAIGAIAAHGAAVCQNEIPAFQIDVGLDHHFAGSLVVRAVLEDTVNKEFASVFADAGYPPFKFISEAMRAPYFAAADHGKIRPLRPHIDRGQIGLAIHKEYPGEPTPVSFGYAKPGVALPSADAYIPDGQGARPYVKEAYVGETNANTLTIFSQGFDLGGMEGAVHHYDRVPAQPVGGRWGRGFMPDPAGKDFSRLVVGYDKLAAMRQTASVHLHYKQWELLQQQLHESGDQIAGARREELAELAAHQLQDHPGAPYKYWEVLEYGITNGEYGMKAISYGVVGTEYPAEARHDFVLPAK